MNRRYIAVAVDIFEHEAFADEPFTRREAWLWLIANAAWKGHRVRMGNAMIELQRGEVVAARNFLAAKWGWGEKKVRVFLEFLAAEKMIEKGQLKGQSKGRLANVVSICNYEAFQTGKAVEGQLRTGLQGRFRAGSGPYSTKDTKDTNSNNPLPPEGGIDGELPLPVPADAVAKPTRVPRTAKLNVAPTYPAEYDALWAVFPRNGNSSKQKGFAAWKRIPVDERPTLIPAANIYAADVEDRRKRNRNGEAAIAHLSTFLNQGTFRNMVPDTAASTPASDPYGHLRGLSRDEWRERINTHANGYWPVRELSPPPCDKGCIAPRDLIAEMGLADKYNPAGIAINLHHPDHPAHRTHGADQ